MNHVWGVYAQDSWKMNRMTVSYGVRYEDVRTSIPEQEIGPGRFVGPRKYNGDVMPIYKSWNPRLGVVYDLLGDGKTAIKFSANKYQAPVYDTLTNGYNPLRAQSASITWNDLNKDDIALENEMNLAQIPANFGIAIPGCSVIANPGATPCGTSWIDPEPQARQFLAVQRRRTTGSAAGHDRERELVPYDFRRTAADVQHVANVRGLHSGANRESDRRQRHHDLQRQQRGPHEEPEPVDQRGGRRPRSGPTRWSSASSARLIHGAQVFGGITMDRDDHRAVRRSSQSEQPAVLRSVADWHAVADQREGGRLHAPALRHLARCRVPDATGIV